MKTRVRLFSILVLLVGIVLRSIFPLSDPPADLSWSGGYYADEGFWTQDARNEALFGHFGADQWHDRFVSPLIHPAFSFLFKLFGPGLAVVRGWAVFISILQLIVLFLCLKKPVWGAWSFSLAALCAVLIAYQRIAILEISALFFCTLALFFWLLSRDRSTAPFAFLTGLSAGAAYLTKATQAQFIPALLLATFLCFPKHNRMKSLVIQVCGISVTVVLYLLNVYFPHHELIAQYHSFYSSQHGNSVFDFLKNILVQPFFFYFNRIPVIFSVSWLVLFDLIFRRRAGELPPLIRFAALWMLCGLLFFFPMGYRPLRYYIPLIIPMTILAGWFLHQFRDTQCCNIRPHPKYFKWVFLLWIFLPGLANVIPVLDFALFQSRLTGLAKLPGFSLIGASLTVIACSLLVLRIIYPESRGRVRIILLLILLFQPIRSISWLRSRTYDIRNTSRKLARMLPEDAVIAGQWAPELCLETRMTSIPMWKGFVNYTDPFEKYGIDYVLSWKYPLGDELALQRKWFPEAMRRTKEIAVFRIKNTPVVLSRYEHD